MSDHDTAEPSFADLDDLDDLAAAAFGELRSEMYRRRIPPFVVHADRDRSSRRRAAWILAPVAVAASALGAIEVLRDPRPDRVSVPGGQTETHPRFACDPDIVWPDGFHPTDQRSSTTTATGSDDAARLVTSSNGTAAMLVATSVHERQLLGLPASETSERVKRGDLDVRFVGPRTNSERSWLLVARSPIDTQLADAVFTADDDIPVPPTGWTRAGTLPRSAALALLGLPSDREMCRVNGAGPGAEVEVLTYETSGPVVPVLAEIFASELLRPTTKDPHDEKASELFARDYDWYHSIMLSPGDAPVQGEGRPGLTVAIQPEPTVLALVRSGAATTMEAPVNMLTVSTALARSIRLPTTDPLAMMRRQRLLAAQTVKLQDRTVTLQFIEDTEISGDARLLVRRAGAAFTATSPLDPAEAVTGTVDHTAGSKTPFYLALRATDDAAAASATGRLGGTRRATGTFDWGGRSLTWEAGTLADQPAAAAVSSAEALPLP